MANGLYTNSELVDTIIVDLNNLLKLQINGQFVGACNVVTQMTQKLLNLKTGIDNDLKSKDKVIEALKNELRAAGQEVVDIPAEELMKAIEEGKENG